MKKALALALMLALTNVHAADEKKADAKKSSKAKPAAKSDKNAAQKAESDVTDWAHRNKIWMHGSSKK
jgi:hypothetical protein